LEFVDEHGRPLTLAEAALRIQRMLSAALGLAEGRLVVEIREIPLEVGGVVFYQVLLDGQPLPDDYEEPVVEWFKQVLKLDLRATEAS
jgi:hypothetical protein